MKFHAPTGRMVIDKGSIEIAAIHMRYTLQKIRELAGLPLDRYERSGMLTPACFAQIAVLETAEAIGIDFGVNRRKFNELDLRDAP